MSKQVDYNVNLSGHTNFPGKSQVPMISLGKCKIWTRIENVL